VVEGATTLAFLGDRSPVLQEARKLAYQLVDDACIGADAELGTAP
jgi:hypothetical protein